MKPVALLLLVIATGFAAAEEKPTGLDGATGNVFKVDPAAKTFELLKETEYDPKTDIGKSRFTIRWDEETSVTRISEVRSFAGIKGPVATAFHGIDDANAKALADGKPFEARVATVYTGAEPTPGIAPDGRSVIGSFTPEGNGDSLSGSIELDGRRIPISMRKRHWRIYHHQPLRPEQLAEGFWKAELRGGQSGGSFYASDIEVTALEDPRKTDDPELPRVLVIGDSISMNYHEAAKKALEGVANYHRNEGNSFSSVHGAANAELWLGDYQEEGFHWDVIQFNHGLHDLKQIYDKATDTFGDYSVSLDLYKESLEREIAILKKTGATLIWASTTPVQQDMKTQYARRKGAAEVFNKAALEVMERHPEILVNDLHGVVQGSPVFDDWRTKMDVHFYKPEEQRLLGEAVANAVRKALEKRGE